MPVPEEQTINDLDFTADVRQLLDNVATARQPQKKKDYSINEFLSHQANSTAQNEYLSQQSLLRQRKEPKSERHAGIMAKTDARISRVVNTYQTAQDKSLKFDMLMAALRSGDYDPKEPIVVEYPEIDIEIQNFRELNEPHTNFGSPTIKSPSVQDVDSTSYQSVKSPPAQKEPDFVNQTTRQRNLQRKLESLTPPVKLPMNLPSQAVTPPKDTYAESEHVYYVSQLEQVQIKNVSHIVRQGQKTDTYAYVKSSPLIKSRQIRLQPNQRRISLPGKAYSKFTLEKIEDVPESAEEDASFYRLSQESDSSDYEHQYEVNTALKDKLSKQIDLFEQYVSVAKRSDNYDAIGLEILDLFIKQASTSFTTDFAANAARSIDRTNIARSHLSKQTRNSSRMQSEMVSPARTKSSLMIPSHQPHSSGCVSELDVIKTPVSVYQAMRRQVSEIREELDRHKNAECVKYEDRIRANKVKMSQIIGESHTEYEILHIRDRTLNQEAEKKRNSLPDTQFQKESDLQHKIKRQIQRRDELSQWGHNNQLVTLRVKVRTMEEIIEQAQRLHKKTMPKEDLANNLERLRKLRDVTFNDLHSFVKKRDQYKWRQWDKQIKNSAVGKFQIISQKRALVYEHNSEPLKKVLSRVEPKLVSLEQELSWLSEVNERMVNICALRFGDEFVRLFRFEPNIDCTENQTYFVTQAGTMTELTEQAQKRSFRHKMKPTLGQSRLGETVNAEALLKIESDTEHKISNMTGLTHLASSRLTNMVEGPISRQVTQYSKKSEDAADKVEPPKENVESSASEKSQSEKPVEIESVRPKRQRPPKIPQMVTDILRKKETLRRAQQKREEEEARVADKSNWLKLAQKGIEKKKSDDLAKQRRLERIALLFESDSEQGEKPEVRLDQLAAKQNMAKFMDLVDQHLNVELGMIQDWEKQRGAVEKQT